MATLSKGQRVTVPGVVYDPEPDKDGDIKVTPGNDIDAEDYMYVRPEYVTPSPLKPKSGDVWSADGKSWVAYDEGPAWLTCGFEELSADQFQARYPDAVLKFRSE